MGRELSIVTSADATDQKPRARRREPGRVSPASSREAWVPSWSGACSLLPNGVVLPSPVAPDATTGFRSGLRRTPIAAAAHSMATRGIDAATPKRRGDPGGTAPHPSGAAASASTRAKRSDRESIGWCPVGTSTTLPALLACSRCASGGVARSSAHTT